MQDCEYDTMRQVEDTYWWYLALRNHVVTTLRKYLGEQKSVSILDAGCGTGGMLHHLREADSKWELHGLDFSPLALAHTKKRGFDHLVQSSIDAIPSADSSFNAVVCLDVLYHKAVDETKAMAELARVLMPNGVLILNLPAFDFLSGNHDIAVDGARRYTKDQLRELLSKHGFAIQQLHYWNAWLFLPIMIWRMLSPSLQGSTRDEPKSDLTHLPAFINQTLALLTKMDITLCRLLHLPFGTSVFAVARKKAS